MDEPIVVGTIIGILANIPKIITNFLFYKLDFSTYHCWHMTVKTFISSKWPFDMHTIIIGGLIVLVLAASFGVGLIYFIKLIGKKYLIFKGIAYTVGTWVFFCLIMGGKLLETPLEAYHSFFDHLLWGVIAILLLSKYDGKVIDKDESRC